jgi:Mn-dependent DtxR family transcriptional regulator
MTLPPIEHKILKVLVERQWFMSTREIAYRARVSWNTADIYLRRFYDRGWVSKRVIGNRYYWKARA